MDSKIIVIISILFSLRAFAQDKVNFRHSGSWKELISESKNNQKIIFIDVYATWCGPCKQMDREVFSDDSIIGYLNKKFISIKIQSDSTLNDNTLVKNQYSLSSNLIKKYHITALPTFLFFNSNGNLAYRKEGFYPAKQFLIICKEAEQAIYTLDYNTNRLLSGELKNKQLLEFSNYLHDAQIDSLSILSAQKCKDLYINNSEPAYILSLDLIRFINNFYFLFDSHDPIIKYMIDNPRKSDSITTIPQITEKTTALLVAKNIINPVLRKNAVPNWDSLEYRIKTEWTSEIAGRSILSSKIKWYTEKKDWDNAIKNHIKKLDTYGIPTDDWGAVYVNNMVWNLILKHSNDPIVLSKAEQYMKEILKTRPTDYYKIDTYANVLYKSGQHNQAIEIEKKALQIAKKSNDIEAIHSIEESVKNMENKIQTW
ncbi:thioredoxin fold domain-containing protein [Chitinophaga sp. 22536]|uniref:thioredoxin family protein n=1 Tax=unclassified Chitinophaga TaxID=2619133 RepID=UPI003F84E12F